MNHFAPSTRKEAKFKDVRSLLSMIRGYRIEKFEAIAVFQERMKSFDESAIECTAHTLFRLSEKQRKVFTCDELKRILADETPLKVGIQYNGNYACYYRYKEQSLLKVVLSFKAVKVKVVTFMVLDKGQLPTGYV